MAAAALPPLVLPPWLVEKDRYNIRLPHIDTLVAIADKGRRPRRVVCPIGPAPSGLYKTAQDTVTRDVPKLAVPTTWYDPAHSSPPLFPCFSYSRTFADAAFCGCSLLK
jgi:hypothetical protein